MDEMAINLTIHTKQSKYQSNIIVDDIGRILNLSIPLNGLYQLHSTDSLVELEFVESNRIDRTLIYASRTKKYIFLREGIYEIFLCLKSKDIGQSRDLTLNKVTKWQLVNLFFKKIYSVATRPERWNNIIAQLKKIGKSSIGFQEHSISHKNIEDTDSHNYREHFKCIYKTEFFYSVSIIIPTKYNHDLLEKCVSSIKIIKNVEYEIIIVDNGSTTKDMVDLLERLSQIDNIKVVRFDIEFNFSRLCNFGAKFARYPKLLFLNDDIEGMDDVWLSEMCSYVETPGVGIVGARLLYPSGDLQHAGIATNMVPGPGHPWRHAKKEVWSTHPVLSTAGVVDAVTGACLMISAELFLKIGGFDERAFPITQNDVDLCLRVRELGLKVVYTPTATLIHKESQSRRPDDHPAEIARQAKERRALFLRHKKYMYYSTFFPTNLRRDTENPSIIS